MIRVRIQRFLTALLVLSIQGCDDSKQVSNPSAHPEPGALECREQNYPCTWNEVAPEIVLKTRALGQVAFLYSLDASLPEVAAFLARQSDVVASEVMGTGVIYRLKGGRPAWVFPANELDHHEPDSRRPGSVAADHADFEPLSLKRSVRSVDRFPQTAGASETLAQWVGINSAFAQTEDNGRSPNTQDPGAGKRALILSPFEYQWHEEGIISGDQIDRAARLIRDYQPRNDGEVIYHADYQAMFANPVGALPDGRSMPAVVTYEDFLNWDEYNLIVLASHGTMRKCWWDPPRGGSTFDAGAQPEGQQNPEMCPQIWAGRAKQESYGDQVGVELYTWYKHVTQDNPGLSGSEATECAGLMDEYIVEWNFWRARNPPGTTTSQEPPPSSPQTTSGKPCQVTRLDSPTIIGLWTPFFEDRYENGLEHVILFLAACRSALNNKLINQFARSGNKNVAVFGFDDTVSASDGFELALRMMNLVRKGRDNAEIFEELKKRDLTHHFSGTTLSTEEHGGVVTPELIDIGRGLTHGRDIVMLVDKSGRELQDGDTVRVQAGGGGEEADRLSIHPQIIGLDDDVAVEMKLEVRIVDEPFPDEKYPPSQRVEKWVHRHDRNVSLGRKHRQGEVVDLEVRVDFEDGDESRWVYRDIRLSAANCLWSVTVSGQTPASGRFEGSGGSIRFDSSAWPPLDIDAVAGDGDPNHAAPNPPWLVISLQQQDVSSMLDPSTVSELRFAIPDMKDGATGKYDRVWGTLRAGTMNYDGNADYLRRNLVGLPEGSGIGHLLTSSVTLARNDSERVEGTFRARFLNPRVFAELDSSEQHPLGVGIHPIPQAEVQATGEFSLPTHERCGFGRPEKLRLPVSQ